MSRKLTTVAALATAAATLAGVASAGPVAVKRQRVMIQVTAASAFTLTPLTTGAIRADGGAADFCCWGQRSVVRDGQAIDIDNPQMTLRGKHGTIVAQDINNYIDLPDGWAVFTGTWNVVHATGVYAGLAGGGRLAGVALANGLTKAQFEGFLTPKQ
jgi:hypothetical protein